MKEKFEAKNEKQKNKKKINDDFAAKILFFSDRTCCVCRIPNKHVQIHHIDGDPYNNVFEDLAVLCLECHNNTMLSGGFGRKLDAEQIILYKQDWLNIVAEKRAEFELQYKKSFIDTSFEVKYATSIAEIYRENKQYSLLAMHYAICNNIELRDKYIEIALKEEKVTDQTICNLRILQGKPELIPKEIIQRELERMEKNKNWSQKARLQYGLGNYKEAVQEYIKSVLKSLENQNFFGAAFYLEELNNRSLVKKLFEMALQKATQEGNLWWQVRTLEHLERFDELKSLILRNAKEIEESGHSLLAIRLAEARNDNIDQKIEIHKEIARGIKVRIYGKEEQ